MPRGRKPLTDEQVKEIWDNRAKRKIEVAEERRKFLINNIEMPELNSKDSIINEILKLNDIRVSWRDYFLMMLNSTGEPLRSIWREKTCSSVIHTVFTKSLITESNYAGLEIMCELPDDFTENIVQDSFDYGFIKFLGRLPGSKKMDLILGKYPQESLANEAYICLNYILENWDEYNYLIFENTKLKEIWNFSQEFNGNVLFPDEINTFFLEKDVDKKYLEWIYVSRDIFDNGLPSNNFSKYYVTEFDNCKLSIEEINQLTLEEQKNNFKQVIDKFLKEDIKGISNWKRLCICILKNDISFGYAGMARTYKERLAREQAIEAFEKIKKKSGK